MRKIKLTSKINYSFKTLTKPLGTKFEVNYGDGFVTVNRFKYLAFSLKGLKKIEEARI